VKNLWLAGIAFGIAQLTKFSTPLLVPLFIFVLLALWIRDMFKGPRHEIMAAGWRYFKSAFLIFLIGFVCVVYPIYFLFTAHYPIAKQVSDTTTILNSFSTGPTPAGQICHVTRCLADLNIWMAGNPVLRPFGQYMLGILMVLQRADGGNTIYFMGRVVGSGGWLYFPLLYLLKEPLPTLVIVVTALILALWWMWKTARAAHWHILPRIFDYVRVNITEFTMGSFIVLYWGYSMHSTLNIGIRHIIPTLPFIYILSAGVWKKWIVRFDLPATASIFTIAATMAKSMVVAFVKYGILVLLLAWLFCETLFAAPHFLSYFNELGGGTMNGYHYVTDSNYDWGQDLLRLRAWVDTYNTCVDPRTTSSNPMICPANIEKNLGSAPIDKIGVDYFGGGNPQYYLGKKEVNWSSSKGDPSMQGVHWLAVSVNTLEGAIQPLAEGQTRNASDSYSWLTALRPPQPGMGNVPPPDFRIGTSIFVYHLP
jgi:hypothetical protein